VKNTKTITEIAIELGYFIDFEKHININIFTFILGIDIKKLNTILYGKSFPLLMEKIRVFLNYNNTCHSVSSPRKTVYTNDLWK